MARADQSQKAGSQFDLPVLDGQLYARIHIRKTLLGRLVGWLYRGGLVRVRFDLEDGSHREFRVIPGNLETGVLVNYFCRWDQAESMMNYLCRGSQGNLRCRALGFYFERWWEYHSAFDITYFRQEPTN